MSDVTAYVNVEVPVRTAYNQWTQFESFPEFMSGVVAVRQLDDRHTRWVTEIAGSRKEFDAEIVEQLPDERIAWRSTDGDVRHSGVVTFAPIDDTHTRVSVDLVWEPKSVLEKAGGAVGVDRLQVKADLERFRQFIEARGAETGQWRGRVPEPEHRPTGYEDVVVSGDEDVVDLLMAQHQRVKELMDRVAAAQGAEKQQWFGELVALLKTHEKGEQRVVHPVTRSSVHDGDATANARLSEEERADQLIAQAEAAEMSADSVEFDAWFERLRHAVLDHAEHEEREEFPKLRGELPAARLRTMAEELVAVQGARN
jgi:hemerythrin superfamily protein/ribosome-associated toxin RatA of RatAB toxin-antitoxin module